MRVFKILFLTVAVLLFGQSAFSQSKVYKEQVSVKALVGSPDEDIINENFDLQQYIESIYINSSKFYNQSLPYIKTGEYRVLLDRGKDLEKLFIKTKELQGVSMNKVDALTFNKSVLYEALYGTYASVLGIVTIKLKEE